MRNKKYPYYENPQIRDLKDLLAVKAEAHPEKSAFVYPVEGGEMNNLDVRQEAAGEAYRHHR